MTSLACYGGLRLRQEGCIHNIVQKHLQANVHIVNLYAEDVFGCQSDAVYHPRGKTVGGRMSCHGYHLVVELLYLTQAGIFVGNELPRQRRCGNLDEGCAMTVEPCHALAVGSQSLHTMALNSRILIHLSLKDDESHAEAVALEPSLPLSIEERLTVGRWRNCNLQSQRVSPLLTLFLFL